MEHPNDEELSAFVTGLCGLFKRENLEACLKEKCEGVKSVYLPNKLKAGYAFIEVRDREALEKILKIKHISFEGRELLIKRFLTGEKLHKYKQEVNSRRIFIHSIPPSWKDNDLRSLFQKFGEIEDAFVIRDRNTGKSRSFGYAIFEEKSVAERVAKLKMVYFRGKKVKVKMHERKQPTKKNQYQSKPFNRAGMMSRNDLNYSGGRLKMDGIFGAYHQDIPQPFRNKSENDLRINRKTFMRPNIPKRYLKVDEHAVTPSFTLYHKLRDRKTAKSHTKGYRLNKSKNVIFSNYGDFDKRNEFRPSKNLFYSSFYR